MNIHDGGAVFGVAFIGLLAFPIYARFACRVHDSALQLILYSLTTYTTILASINVDKSTCQRFSG